MKVVRFYAREADHDLCQKSIATQSAVTVLGVTPGGSLDAFTGRVEEIERGHNLHPGYPLRIAMRRV